jgi:hypothetical protein
VGRETLGRIMNVIGEPIDECGPISTPPPPLPLGGPAPRRGPDDPPPSWADASASARVQNALQLSIPPPYSPSHATSSRLADAKSFLPIHREAPSFDQQSVEMEMLTTGIKVPTSPLSARPPFRRNLR